MKASVLEIAAGTKIYNPFRTSGMAAYERVTFNSAEQGENQDGEPDWMINYTDSAGKVHNVITCDEYAQLA